MAITCLGVKRLIASLRSAVWSGGSFVYVPPGVHLDTPLQAYFRVNQERMGQFERTLIIIDEGAQAHYIEGCTAPIYSTESFHSGVIEIVVAKNARFRYTTIQNWSNNVYNLVTKRAMAYRDSLMEWVDGNLGSKLTMKYTCVGFMVSFITCCIRSSPALLPGLLSTIGTKMCHTRCTTFIRSVTAKSCI